jgi:hypothetical protein
MLNMHNTGERLQRLTVNIILTVILLVTEVSAEFYLVHKTRQQLLMNYGAAAIRV